MPTTSRGRSFKSGPFTHASEDGSGIIARLSRQIAVRRGDCSRGPRGRCPCGHGSSAAMGSVSLPNVQTERAARRPVRPVPFRRLRRGSARRPVIPASTWSWCERGDSNPHGLPHWHLRPARLPVPPLSRPRENIQYIARLVGGAPARHDPEASPCIGRRWSTALLRRVTGLDSNDWRLRRRYANLVARIRWPRPRTEPASPATG